MKWDKVQILRGDVAIPEAMLRKADDAFAMIRRETEQETDRRETGMEPGKGSRRLKTKMKKTAILAAAMAAVLCTAGFACYEKWVRGLEKELHVTEEIKKRAEETGLTDFPEQSVTCNGVTVTVKQSIVDNYYACLYFEIKGFALPEGREPAFRDVEVTVAGESAALGADFYDGIIMNEDGKPVYEDGSPLERDENGNLITKYQNRDGTLEYHMILSSGNKRGRFLNKPVHVSLRDLGVYSEKANPVEVKVAGEWVLTWTLQGSGEIYEAECNEPLGDTGVSVTGVEISPVSIKAVYDAPRQTVEVQAVDGTTGETLTCESYAEPPALTGVKMKDGTCYPYLYMGPGLSGYTDEYGSRYVEMFAIDRILDVSQVEALLFRKDEADFYVVEIAFCAR